jgi:hypothetical protein
MNVTLIHFIQSYNFTDISVLLYVADKLPGYIKGIESYKT